MNNLVFDDLIIKKLNSENAEELSGLLKGEDKEYSKYFIPFDFDFQTILHILVNLQKDSFWGIYTGDKLVGFYMLRGFDKGYDVPSYGVWISKIFAGNGLSKLTLQHAISYCRINHIKEIMLKVHPENFIAKKIYEDFGFMRQGIDPKNNHIIYRKKLL